MKARIALACLLVAFSCFGLASAQEQSCAADIDAFRQSVQQRETAGKDVGTAPQSTGARLEHQPTPNSVARAETNAKDEILAILTQAEKLNLQGRRDECENVIREGRLLLNP
jgi:hypothetical protein